MNSLVFASYMKKAALPLKCIKVSKERNKKTANNRKKTIKTKCIFLWSTFGGALKKPNISHKPPAFQNDPTK